MPTPAPMAILWELVGFGVGEDVEDEDVVGEVIGRLVVVEDVAPAELESEVVVVEDIAPVELESDEVIVEDIDPVEPESDVVVVEDIAPAEPESEDGTESLLSWKVSKPVEQSQFSSLSQQNSNESPVAHLFNITSPIPESFCLWSTFCIDNWKHLNYLLLTNAAVFGTSIRQP